MIVSIFALVEYIGCFIKYICQSMSNIISKTLLILSFSPFLLLIDLGLHVLFFFMKLFIYIGVCLHILFINLLKILNYEVDSS